MTRPRRPVDNVFVDMQTHVDERWREVESLLLANGETPDELLAEAAAVIDDFIDPKEWPRIMALLRALPRLTEDEDANEPEPFI